MFEKEEKLSWRTVGIYTIMNIVISISMIFLLSAFILADFVEGNTSKLSSGMIGFIVVLFLFIYMINKSKELTKRYYYKEILLSTVISFSINFFSKLVGFPIIKLIVEKLYDLVIKFVSQNSTASIEEVNAFIDESGIFYFHGISIYLLVPVLTGIFIGLIKFVTIILKKFKDKKNRVL